MYSAASTVTQSFFGAPPDNTIVNPQLLIDGSFQLAFYGTVNTNYTLQASTDLRNWWSLFSFTCTNSPTMLVDTNSTSGGGEVLSASESLLLSDHTATCWLAMS